MIHCHEQRIMTTYRCAALLRLNARCSSVSPELDGGRFQVSLGNADNPIQQGPTRNGCVDGSNIWGRKKQSLGEFVLALRPFSSSHGNNQVGQIHTHKRRHTDMILRRRRQMLLFLLLLSSLTVSLRR
jgi:hypothetical protein